jgi:LysM repeat protein
MESGQRKCHSERVQRMKTATSQAKSFKAMAIAAAVTVGIGLSLPATLVIAQESGQRTVATGTGIPLAADAPDRYTVRQGDTLWDISKVFLRDPWYWPEIWYLNPQVKNPHLIYPGDTLVLLSVNGMPQVQVAERGPEGAAAESAPLPPTSDSEGAPTRSGSGVRISPRVRSQPISSAITAIPYDAVASFMGRPSMLTKEQVKSGPYLMGVRDSHIIGGEDNEVYARGIQGAAVGTHYNFIHVDGPMRDPETNKVLGYRAVFAGVGTVTSETDPTKLSAGQTRREVLRGDKLFPEEVTVNLDFLPHPVAEDVRGAIMAVDGVTVAGGMNVVALNRGTNHGLEVGHVLAINQKGEKVRDIYKQGDKDKFWSIGKRVKLPDERIGIVMVFKTYERMSYGLIMEATHPVRVGDLVGAP